MPHIAAVCLHSMSTEKNPILRCFLSLISIYTGWNLCSEVTEGWFPDSHGNGERQVQQMTRDIPVHREYRNTDIYLQIFIYFTLLSSKDLWEQDSQHYWQWEAFGQKWRGNCLHADPYYFVLSADLSVLQCRVILLQRNVFELRK